MRDKDVKKLKWIRISFAVAAALLFPILSLSAHNVPTGSADGLSHIDNVKDGRGKKDYIFDNGIYVQAGYSFLSYSGMGFGIGGYYKKINAEFNYILGLAKSKTIFWNDKTGRDYPFAANYKPSGFNFKLGYGIRLNRQMRITPQIGFHYIGLSEKPADINSQIGGSRPVFSSYEAARGSKAGSLGFGARYNVGLLPHFGLSANLEYLICVSKSNGFKALSDVSNQIKGYAEGFGVNVCLNLFF